jgi:hypothetical protein
MTVKQMRHDPDYRHPSLGRECNECRVPIDPKSRRCTLCNKYYPRTILDFDKDRCEHCGSYQVVMNEFMQWWCDDCQQWIESTNEGNGVTFGDCYECGNGFKKEEEEQVICYWCT